MVLWRSGNAVVCHGFARSREAGQNSFMYYVYFLKSLKNGDLYIGSTENVDNRLRKHNNGKVKSTKFYRPWQLLGFEAYNTRSEAVKREMFLKNHQQKEILKKKYNLI